AIDVGVADADTARQHRHAGVGGHEVDQLGAAAGHDDVDVLAHLQELADQGAVGVLDQLQGAFWDAGRRLGFARDAGEYGVAAKRFRAAADDAGVAGLEAQRGDIDRHVGPAFEDRAEDTQRYTTPA